MLRRLSNRLAAQVLGILLGAACAGRSGAGGAVARRDAAPEYRPYVFTLEGRPWVPARVYSMEGEPERPRPGDVIMVEEIPIRLGPERVLHLSVADRLGEARVHAATPGGPRRLIGLRAGTAEFHGDIHGDMGQELRRTFQALARLTPAELLGLRGLSLRLWPPGVGETLARLDPRRSCIAVSDGTTRGEALGVSAIPGNVDCLILGDGILKDPTSLARFRDLRLLVADDTVEFDPETFDVRRHLSSRGLRLLHLIGQELSGVEALRELRELRDLDLSGSFGFRDVGFVTGLGQLRRLRVRRTRVGSLAPAQGLRFLREIDADATEVEALPDAGFPALRRMSLLGTPVRPREVERFRARNPRCAVESGLMAKLRRVVAPADRVRVRTGGTCFGHHVAAPRPLFELRGSTSVVELMAALEVEEPETIPTCECRVSLSIEFFQGQRLLTVLSVDLGELLDGRGPDDRHVQLIWRGGWPGRVNLTAVGLRRLARWLARHGHTEPLKLLQRQAGGPSPTRSRSTPGPGSSPRRGPGPRRPRRRRRR